MTTLARKPVLIAAAATAALLAIGTLTVVRVDASTPAAQVMPTVEVDVANVLSRTVTDWQSYSGRLDAVDRVDIKPLVSGTITAVHFKDGQLVKKGDALFTIDPRPYAAEVDRAAAQLASAQARDVFTSTDLARAQRLIADNAIAKKDFDQKENAAREAVANVKAAQAALETARINLGYTQIVAPVAGRVSRAEITVGNTVSAGAQSPALTTVVSVSPIYAAFDVDEQTYLRYLSKDTKTNGVPVDLGLANESGYSRKGTVYSVDNRFDTTSGTIRVRARFDNADGALVPGLYARIRVGGGEPHPALLVDEAAVGTDQSKKYVMVVDQANKAQYREVQLGERHGGLVEIAGGLKDGERIVVNGLQRIRPGDAVTPKVVKMAGDTGDAHDIAPTAVATTGTADAAKAPAPAPAAAANDAPTTQKTSQNDSKTQSVAATKAAAKTASRS
ncbi:efflux RND transporter periplasmic adaptor subunit [Pandoraea sputorum]|uniref:Efflux pump periplasmic linker BepF n=1 Tax=Pandoraea sputorum TaxID=93222 RepID=A0A239SIM9_9BURK|nr:efflux RND transporter periplasmic adaptor subunit [Pandoraea sputorum]AJC16892.1 efflux transporter periplasmic adaptor subunit [Pandoraea sputorum]SNU84533.1 Efflux pump periplasmic linker BepF [Pandoraea sputorum]VVD77467.1 efflux transporter periplasmic adaptor subunit [Pandoraea sputorum]VVE76404.1 efflux transporter periplasmic adaptor subunit [Pandoraea sputorum]VVE77981.1 efflux transporter periplasmic adaptor subunit [Pandoraea sputorum]